MTQFPVKQTKHQYYEMRRNLGYGSLSKYRPSRKNWRRRKIWDVGYCKWLLRRKRIDKYKRNWRF